MKEAMKLLFSCVVSVALVLAIVPLLVAVTRNSISPETIDYLFSCYVAYLDLVYELFN